MKLIKKYAVLAGAFLMKEIKDPAVHRAVVLAGAAYCIRKAPFLDEAAAEGLSDKAMVAVGILLSKLPGSAESSKGGCSMMGLILGAVAGAFAIFGIKAAGKSVIGAFKKDPGVKVAEAVNENHAVAGQVAAAKTDEAADAALARDARSDHA